ncbi:MULTISPECIES: trypsin-like peptidase domain-containing protein [unclassified Streptomyces]|uniref:nSTAND1 domain-containing NTPase n=1 Tax=unclassified Streptomyces TaxID=2593676 RepID=UPI00278BF316|nr:MULTISPECIES: trypsin-like peptidase domain-containing protein [unclassified Streptomyces]
MTLIAPGPGAGVLGASLLRISDERGEPRGVGFLVADGLAFTCAHVVSAALGLAAGAALPEGAEVGVDLPLAGAGAPDASRARARVVHWEPARESGAGDIAVLELVTALPDARPVRLVESADVWGHPARAFGFPAGRRGGVWHSGVLRDRQAGGWVQADLAADGRYRVTGGFSGGPVWDDELGGVVGMITVAEAGEPPASYLIPADTLLGVRPGLRELTLPASPFKGLDAFREADAGRFYGRVAESGELAAHVVRERRSCLVGPSGCGKSSLALAGAVPLLRDEGFAVAVLRPASGSGPAAALAAALLPLLEPEASAAQRFELLPRFTDRLGEGGLPDLVAQVLRRQERERLLVVVDQLEEVFGAGPDISGELAGLLFGERLVDRLHVLTTLRADFLETALAHPALGPALRRGLYALGPLDAEGLREIVTAPVAAIPGVEYESGLVDLLLADTGDAPGALPLLGFTLDQLWRGQTGGLLTHRAYGELGGVTGAIGRHAERMWAANVPEDEQPAARRLLTALVRVPPGSGAATRRTAARAELDPVQWEIAQRLAETRLLVTGRGPEGAETVELAHEALFGGWRLLAELVAEDRAFLGWRELLRHDLERWERADRAPDLLPNATALATAEPWLRERAADLSEAERGYLDEGRARRRAGLRRRRFLRSGLALAAVLVLVFGALFSYYRYESAERAAQSASRAFAQSSADQADNDPVLSAQLALAAYKSAHTREARDALLRAYLAQDFTDRVLTGQQEAPIGTEDIINGDAGAIDTSTDGDVVFARSTGGQATLYTHVTADEVRREHIEEPVQIAQPLVSANGRRAAFLTLEGRLIWYDVHRDGADGQLLSRAHRLPAVPGAGNRDYDSYRSVLSADGRYVAAIGEKYLLWWDLEAPAGSAARSGRVPAPSGVSHDIRFAPDGRTVLIKSYEPKKASYEVKAVDRVTGKSRTLAGGKGVDEVLLAGDGKAAAFCAEHGYGVRVEIWRQSLTDGAPRSRPRAYEEKDLNCSAMQSVDATGRRVAVRESGWINLVDLERREIALSTGKPSGDAALSTYPRLAVADGEPAQLLVGANRVVYSRLTPHNRIIPASQSRLNGDGSKLIVTLADASRIGIVPVGGNKPTVRVYRPKPYWKPLRDDFISFDREEKHLAERVGVNRFMIRDFPTLKAEHEITTAPLPPDDTAKSLPQFFDRSGNLVTVSGTVIQLWDADSGRQLARYDAKVLHPRMKDGAPLMTVSAHPEPGRVAITVWDQRYTRVVDLATGRTRARLDTGTNTNRLAFAPGGRYFALLRRGGAIELWQRDPLRKVLGGLGTGGGDEAYAIAFPDSTSFVLAAKSTVRTYRFGDPGEEKDVANLGLTAQNAPYRFPSLSADGRTALVDDDNGRIAPVRFDPDVWRTTLCDVIGHTEPDRDQRTGLPAALPDQPLCPKPGSRRGEPNPGRPELMRGDG